MALLGMLSGTVLAQDSKSKPIVLRWKQAQCIAKHAEDYKRQPGDPLLLFPGFCDEGNFAPTPMEIAAATSKNAFEAGVIDIRISSGSAKIPLNPKAAAIVVTDDQLTCLTTHFDRVVVKSNSMPGDPGGEDIAEIDFGRCAD